MSCFYTKLSYTALVAPMCAETKCAIGQDLILSIQAPFIEVISQAKQLYLFEKKKHEF